MLYSEGYSFVDPWGYLFHLLPSKGFRLRVFASISEAGKYVLSCSGTDMCVENIFFFASGCSQDSLLQLAIGDTEPGPILSPLKDV